MASMAPHTMGSPCWSPMTTRHRGSSPAGGHAQDDVPAVLAQVSSDLPHEVELLR